MRLFVRPESANGGYKRAQSGLGRHQSYEASRTSQKLNRDEVSSGCPRLRWVLTSFLSCSISSSLVQALKKQLDQLLWLRVAIIGPKVAKYEISLGPLI